MIYNRYAVEIAVHTPFKPLIYGTTHTSSLLSSKDGFSKPVYYDWGANWEHISKIIYYPEVKQALQESIELANEAESNNFNFGYADWDERTFWPFLFSLDVRRNYVVKAGLKKNYLSKDLVKQFNLRLANWYNSIGKRLIKEDRMSLFEAEYMYGRNLMSEFKSGRKIVQIILKSIDKVLYKTDGPLRELLLFAPTKTNAFKPFLYKLAEILSPPGTKLTAYDSDIYSVVVDEERNIVFDNFLYFIPHVGCIYEALAMASGGTWQNTHSSQRKKNDKCK